MDGSPALTAISASNFCKSFTNKTEQFQRCLLMSQLIFFIFLFRFLLGCFPTFPAKKNFAHNINIFQPGNPYVFTALGRGYRKVNQ